MTPEQARHTIGALITLAGKSDLAELELADGDLHLRLHRPRGKAAGVAPADRGKAVEEAERDSGVPQVPTPRMVHSQVVGRFYRARPKSSDPLVHEGDMIAIGQAVGVVEAMNMFGDVASTEAGRVLRILVSDGVRIEYGQPLLELE